MDETVKDKDIIGPGIIGRSQPRPAASRAVAGRGQYTDDLVLPNMAHVAFLRSPYPHAWIVAIETDRARHAPGVVAIFTGKDLVARCTPWQTRLALMPSHHSAIQPPMAVDEACWQGEAVVAVVAESRAEAEDALELIDIEWEELASVATIAAALQEGSPPVHTSLAGNLALDVTMKKGETTQAFADAAVVAEHEFTFSRQTAVSLEPRSILASFDRNLDELIVYQSHQAPFQMREVFAEQLGLDPEKVRVIAKDVGGAFGMKLHAYADEMALVTIAMLLQRPVKFIADRLEAFLSDAHTREIKAHGRIALDAGGKILGIEVDLVAGFGAYSIYPRGSFGEVLQSVQMTGAAYEIQTYKGRARGVFQNKALTGAYRGVGQPIACAITEQLMDCGAAALGVDPVALRKLNHRQTGSDPTKTDNGVVLETLSLDVCMDEILRMMDYAGLRQEQAVLRERGVYRGIGISNFVELTGLGSGLYGPQGLRVSALESCRLILDASGSVRCETSVTDQGQGTLTGIAQIVAQELGVGFDTVRIVAGDTNTVPYGGGAWASRGIALGGEAALRAARELRTNILVIAASLLQADASTLRIIAGVVVNADLVGQMTLAEIASTARYRTHLVPLDIMPPLETIAAYSPQTLPYLATNGVQGALVEVDCGTGLIKVLKHWVVDDCGRVINPLLVDEQIRGGVVQGIGATLFEECSYSPEGQLQNGNLADYLLPMAAEMPDIEVAHVSSPTRSTTLGAKGVGEAGTIGAVGAIWTAVNDALRSLGARVNQQPFTPEQVLDSLIEAERRAKD